MSDLRRIELSLDLILVELRTLNTLLRLGEVSCKPQPPVEVYETTQSMEVRLSPEAAQGALRR